MHIASEDYHAQFAAAKRADTGLRSSYAIFQSVVTLRKAVSEREQSLDAITKAAPQATSALAPGAQSSGSQPATPQAANAQAVDPQTKASADALKKLDAQITEILEGTKETPGVGGVNRDLARTSFMIQTGDAAPAETAIEAINDSCAALNKAISTWRTVNSDTIPAANSILEKSKLAPLPFATAQPNAAEDACHL